MIVTSARAKMSPKELVDIKDLKLGMKNITLQVIILDIGKIVDIVFECFVCSLFLFFFLLLGSRSLTKDGSEVRSVKVADKSASINMCVYNEPGNYLQPGDICRIIRW